MVGVRQEAYLVGLTFRPEQATADRSAWLAERCEAFLESSEHSLILGIEHDVAWLACAGFGVGRMGQG